MCENVCATVHVWKSAENSRVEVDPSTKDSVDWAEVCQACAEITFTSQTTLRTSSYCIV